MDKTILKKFAVESRKDLMEKIKNKINTFYIDEEFKKEQKGDVYILSNEKHSLSLTNEEYQKRELLIKRIKELSLEQVIEEAAYTWFNRIIAIRYMEINDYLPLTKDNQSLGIRVLSSKDNTPDPEILKFTNLINPDLDINFKKEKYVELKDDNEKFKYVLLLICKKLGRVIPQVFDGITDYIDILIPDNLLNDSGFITKIITEIPENNYNQVEIIGWLYQFYISEKKNEVFEGLKNNKKITKENIPAATQLFTPNWVVKYMVENSIGRLWIEHNGNSSLLNNWKYYIKEKEIKNKEQIDIKNIKIIDPCSGSGHILVYIFEILYQIYQSLGYKKDDIPKMIIENNLNGLDVDDRAGQLSILSVLLKAREYDKKIFNKRINLNILSIQESNSLDRNVLELIKGTDYVIDDTIDYIYDIFIDAKEYGSLLKVEKKDYTTVLKIIDEMNHKQLNIIELAQLKEINEKYLCLVEQAILLSQKYDSVITNPPYMGQSGMNRKLVDYLKREYNVSKSDLFAIFIDVALNMTKEGRYTSMITMQTWMFLSSYISIRKRIIFNNKIVNMVHLGAGAFEELNAFNVLTSMFVIKKTENNDGKCIFVRLNKIYNYNEKEKEFFNKKLYYEVNQADFKKMPNFIIGYWISEKMKNILNSDNTMEKVSPPRTGMMTSDNKKFLRFWFEPNFSNIGFDCKNITESIESNKKWFPYIKGGNFRRWYGNRENVVNWFNAGEDIKRNGMTSFRGKDFYFREGITWSIFGFENFCARYSPLGSLFDIAGTSTFPLQKDFNLILGLLNSKIAYEILILLNPSVNFQNGDIKKIPIVIPNKDIRDDIDNLVNLNIELSKQDWDSFETSWDFIGHPLIKNITGQYIRDLNEKPNYYLLSVFDDWQHKTEIRFNKLKENEEKLNEIFIDIYGLKDELTPEVEDKDITIRKADKEREIKSLISYAVGCMFGRYSLDKEGLIYAGGDFDEIYKKCKKTDGGWAGASLSNYKVLNDNGQEIDLSFEVDNDNIIPITDESYFGDDIVERFKTFISVVYGEKTLNENLDFIAETLGKKGTETSEDTIRRYFVNDFFNDHVKTYQKRPIYWLFDSGKKNGFKALVYMHRYNENLIPKVRLDYLHRMQTTYEKLLVDVNDKLTSELSMTDKKETQKRQADLNAKLQEIREYDEKIAHIANQRISIDLDDGVKANYDKFKDILAKIK